MKFSLLWRIVIEYSERLRLNAAYNGSWDDGGCGGVLNRLREYQDSLVIKLDLRPSEINKLNDLEIGEPEEFSKEILDYKIRLAKNIKL